MDPKGIDIPGLIPNLGTSIRSDKKSAPVIKPVDKSKEGTMRTLLDADRSGQAASDRPSRTVTEEDARRAAAALADELQDRPELKVDWTFRDDPGILVVIVKDTRTDRVIREIPPEQIIEALSKDASGLLVDRTA